YRGVASLLVRRWRRSFFMISLTAIVILAATDFVNGQSDAAKAVIAELKEYQRQHGEPPGHQVYREILNTTKAEIVFADYAVIWLALKSLQQPAIDAESLLEI